MDQQAKIDYAWVHGTNQTVHIASGFIWFCIIVFTALALMFRTPEVISAVQFLTSLFLLMAVALAAVWFWVRESMKGCPAGCSYVLKRYIHIGLGLLLIADFVLANWVFSPTWKNTVLGIFTFTIAPYFVLRARVWRIHTEL